MERLIAGLGWLVALSGCWNAPSAPTTVLPDGLHEHLHEGDLVFRRGRDLMSRLVLAGESGSQYSHVGLLVGRDSTWMVLHALPDEGNTPGGVRLEALTTFLAPDKAAAWAVYAHPEVRASSSGFHPDAYLGRPFDATFMWSDDARLYCTELIVRAWSAMGVAVEDQLTFLNAPLLAEPVLPPDALLYLEGLRLVHRAE